MDNDTRYQRFLTQTADLAGLEELRQEQSSQGRKMRKEELMDIVEYALQAGLLTDLLEQEAGRRRINGLEEISERRSRQAEIHQMWQVMQAHHDALKRRIESLPVLPSEDVILWAHNVLAMDCLAFLEIDTTGTGQEDEIVRVALSDRQGHVFFDQMIKPEQAKISAEACARNGLTNADVEGAPVCRECWPRIQRACMGRYVLSFSQDWDRRVLKEAAERSHLSPLMMVGECLQRRCTAYYSKEYYLSLETVAARMGHPLISWDAPARLKAQSAILDGLARGITDLSPSKKEEEKSHEVAGLASLCDEDLRDLDDHPF